MKRLFQSAEVMDEATEPLIPVDNATRFSDLDHIELGLWYGRLKDSTRFQPTENIEMPRLVPEIMKGQMS